MPIRPLLDQLNAALRDGGPLPLAELRAALGPRGSGNVALAQMNPTPGDLAGNARKILHTCHLAEALEVDMVIFPELALMGYPIRDVITRHPFLVDENLKWLQMLARRIGQTRAVVGFVEPRYTAIGDKARGKPFFNSLAILGDGLIEGIVRKSLLPTYCEFEDDRTFERSPYSGWQDPRTLASASWGFDADDPHVADGLPHTVWGRRYGFSICEDTWGDEDFFVRPLYTTDPMARLAAHQPDVFINISASPSRSRKEQMKQQMLSHAARKYGVPLVYVNQVGAVDECSFEGASRVYDGDGELLARAAAFEEQLLIVNPHAAQASSASLIWPVLDATQAEKRFNPQDTADLPRMIASITQGIADYFAKTGFQRAVLGLSGGLDSSVAAVLLAHALGPENVLGVSMPAALTHPNSRNDARLLAEQLGIQFIDVPITPMVTAFEVQLGAAEQAFNAWGDPSAQSFASDNMQAMSRATLLRLLGNEYRALPIATSDKSELYLGYATVNGDMSGALSPLGDVPKTKVRLLARHFAEQYPVLAAVVEKPSGAELALNPETGQPLTAEEALMPYEFADEIIWRIETLQQSKAEMMDACFYWEQSLPLSKTQKQTWLDRFYQRMAGAVFKWWVAPPMIIVEGNGSIAKSDYHHPITAGRIQWQGHSLEAINHALDAVLPVVGPVV
jgi:NAD+ synthase (glutamine-hydrolysing)